MTSFKQLRYLDAVARHGHFGKAAAHCAVSQPALSMQIQELEQELGVQLVERRRQGAQLTEAGREVARRAQRILNEVRDIGDFARQCREPLSAPLRLGVIPTVAPYVLPALLPLVRADYPQLVLQVRETHTQQLLAELKDGTLDLLLLALPVEQPEVETLELIEDRFLLAMPPGRKLRGRVRATPELFEHDRLLLLEEGHCLRDQALAFCHLRRVEGVDTFGASSLSTIVQMVANGMGLTFLPEISIGLEAMGGRVSIGRFADPEPSRTLGLAWRVTSPRKADFIALGKLVVDAVRQCQKPSAEVVAGRRSRADRPAV
ncbi:MAG TPA: LysR substrate-binding domain-containing protein [Hyphomicrobiaceae bacterium]|nr:LysR substrate-binding domain-containing protein [Hyphomicrobiaceae bacterium]